MISKEATLEFVDLYMRFIHDRPQTLFHEKTLWNEIYAGTICECLLIAICATGCKFSDNLQNCQLSTGLKDRSRALFSQQLETISIPNIQTCILLANLYAAEQNNALEALYFGVRLDQHDVKQANESQGSLIVWHTYLDFIELPLMILPY